MQPRWQTEQVKQLGGQGRQDRPRLTDGKRQATGDRRLSVCKTTDNSQAIKKVFETV